MDKNKRVDFWQNFKNYLSKRHFQMFILSEKKLKIFCSHEKVKDTRQYLSHSRVLNDAP